MRRYLKIFIACFVVTFVVRGTWLLCDTARHYREACLECGARCEGYAPEVSMFRDPSGIRDCYCNTNKPGPDQLRKDQAQEAIDRITTQPPENFHI
jgi:hypothetical protein